MTHARPPRTAHNASARQQQARQHITRGPASQAGQCQGRVDTETTTTADRERRVRRILGAYSRRVGDGDVEALALMLGLAEEIDTAIAEAVKDLQPLRLLLGRDRLQARHHPPGRPAALDSIVLMSARCVTNWTWPQVQVAASRRLLLHVRKAGDARWRPSEHMPRSSGLSIR